MLITEKKGQFTKMNSEALLKKVSNGGMNKRDAKIAATILERRFPTPTKTIAFKGKKVA